MEEEKSAAVMPANRRMQPARQIHTIDPFYDGDSQILILGSFPSIKSREVGFFYGHPQNRFWKVTAAVFGEVPPASIEEKKVFLRKHHMAMWDTIRSCTITGSSDSSIRDVVPNDIGEILSAADIREIYCNGATSYNLYMKYIFPSTGRKPVKMPSTSPANAAWNMDRLTEVWQRIRKE